MVDKIKEMVANIDGLASFPEVALRIDEVLEDASSTMQEIAELIEPDPALSSALLRIANSAMYSRSGAVDNVVDAIKLVGSREVRDLTYAIFATESFKGLPNELVSVEDFWRHSLYCASAAQNLAAMAKVCRGVSMFTAGLLHDIGQLVMFNQAPELSRQALLLALEEDDGRSTYLAERQVFGFDHMDVGSELATMWKFPDTLKTAISCHHNPMECTVDSEIAVVTHVANSLAVLAELESHDFNDGPRIEQQALQQLKLEDEQLFDIVTVSRDAAESLVSMFVS